MPGSQVVDVHQHLWPVQLVDRLRTRTAPPRLDDWRLLLDDEPAFEIDPSDHDPAKRAARNADDRIDLALVSLSSPLGIERLPVTEAAPLLDAWHEGALSLQPGFGVWAAAGLRVPDPAGLADVLDAGCVGLQVPADAMGSPAALTRLAPLLAVCEARNKPVFVHPGPARQTPGGVELPGWWVPVVDYVGQLTAAWWSWHAVGRTLLPDLRLCFAAGAGLAPVHHERLVARGGRMRRIDPDVFVETSSYGPRGLDAVIRVLGIDTVVLGSDRPYAAPTDPGLGDAATHAIRCSNPQRLLEGGHP